MDTSAIETRTFQLPTPDGQLFAQQWTPTEPGAAERPPLVLLHDSLGSVELWRDLPAKLARAANRPVIAYDRPGFGRSDPQAGQVPLDFIRGEAHAGFAHVRAALAFDRFALFGHSVGGGMAVGIAAAYPDACEALVTVSAQAFVEDRTLEGVHAAQQAFAQPAQVGRLRRYHGDKAPWVLRAWIDRWLDPAFAGWNLDQDLPRVTCPTLVVYGNHDEYGSVRHPERIAGLAAGPSIVHVGDWGHMPHREDEGAVVDLVAGWLQGAGAGSRTGA